MRSKLALTLLLVGALLTLGAKWAETPIRDFTCVAGTWKGASRVEAWSTPIEIIIEEDGSYSVDNWRVGGSGRLAARNQAGFSRSGSPAPRAVDGNGRGRHVVGGLVRF